MATMKYECGLGSHVDYEEAKKLFDFFCANVEFSESSSQKLLDRIIPLVDEFALRQGNS